jgi:hypothetical protein
LVMSKTPKIAAIVRCTLGGLATILVFVILLWKRTARTCYSGFISSRKKCLR